jgi:hypothetical protein
MNFLRKKITLTLLAVAIVLQAFLPVIQVSAAPVDTAPLADKVKAYIYTNALAHCISESSGDVTQTDAVAYQWFNNKNMGTLGPTLTTNGAEDGEYKVACNAWNIQPVLSFFGWSTPIQAMCDLGYQRQNGSNCVSGTGDWRQNSGNVGQTALNGVYKKYGQVNMSGAIAYEGYYGAFLAGCGGKSLGPVAGASAEATATGTSNNGDIINIANPTTGAITPTYFSTIKDDGADIAMWQTPGGNDVQQTCSWLAGQVSNNATAYSNYVKANGPQPDVAATVATSTGDPGNFKDTCAVDGIGWIVCPVAGFLGKITDGAYAMVEQLLVFQISKDPFSTDPAINPAFPIWSSIRNIANVAFIVALFVVIFSQATSVGLGNYGIKKMLPRIIVAAILVNLSYYLCILAIDVSNILGAGMDGIVRAPLSALKPEGDSWESVLSGILVGTFAGVAIGAAYFFGVLALALPMLVAALLAIVTAIIVLVARHALLILLVVVSPLAFVAYILPNTENLFDKWRKTFTTLLILYPLVAILFSGSQVAAAIMRATAPAGVTGAIITILSLAVMAIPLFALPFLVKFSGGVLGRVAGMVNNPNKGLIDRTRKAAQGNVARNRGKYAADYDPTRTGTRKLGNLRARGAKPFLGVTKAGRDRSQFALSQMGDQYEAEETKLAAATLSQRGISGDKYALYDLAKETNRDGKKNDKFLRRASANQLGSIGAADLLENLYRGEIDPATGNRTGSDEGTKRLAAKAIGANADKLASAAQPLFFDAVTFESEMKKRDHQKATGAPVTVDTTTAAASGAGVARQKVTAQMGPQYLANLKADQIIGARKVIQDTAAVDPVAYSAAVDSTRNAIISISRDQRVLSNMTDEQVVEVGKMAQKLGITTAQIDTAGSTVFADRYTTAAGAVSASRGGRFNPGEAPPVSPSGRGWS